METEPSSVKLSPLQRFNQAFDLLSWMAVPVRRGEDQWMTIPEVGIFIYKPRDPRYSPSICYEPYKTYVSKKLLDPESSAFKTGLFEQALAGLAQVELV